MLVTHLFQDVQLVLEIEEVVLETPEFLAVEELAGVGSVGYGAYYALDFSEAAAAEDAFVLEGDLVGPLIGTVITLLAEAKGGRLGHDAWLMVEECASLRWG